MTIEEIPAAPEPSKRQAVRWLRNGDHPGDRVGEELKLPGGGAYHRLEGAVVRFFRHPKFPGTEKHWGSDGCGETWRDHGWIDEGDGGITVCPGDLVLDLPDGTHEVIKEAHPVYRDRTESYVPAGLHVSDRPRMVEVTAPRRADPAWAFGVLEQAVELIDDMVAEADNLFPASLRTRLKHWQEFADRDSDGWSGWPRPAERGVWAIGRADELNRDQGDWQWADVSGDGTHWARFDGHLVQVDVELHTANGHDVHHWKGRDDIRAGGSWTIALNRQQVYEGRVGGDVQGALQRIQEKVRTLINLTPLDHGDPRPYAEQLVGRRVYYHSHPAVVSSASVLHQGCVMLRPVGTVAFPRRSWQLDDEPDGVHDEQDLYDEYEAREAKVEIDDPAIYWWRKRSYSPDEPDERYRRREPKGFIKGDGPDDGTVTA
jgi:hypothetical protein